MPPPLALRPVESGDLEFLFHVYASTREEELAVVSWSPAEKEAFLRQQFNAQDRYYRTTFTDAQFSIICAESEAIGRLYVWRQPDELRIIDISLLPAWRGRGVGGRLLRELLVEAAATSRRVTIHVEKHNPALRLYERLGFRPVSDNGVYWQMEWVPGAKADAAGAEAAGGGVLP
jgi:ribosomal protein S18 acetylase RimI-like enzyme